MPQYRRGVRSWGRGRGARGRAGASARGRAGTGRGGRPPTRDRRLDGRFPKPLLFLSARWFGDRRRARALVGQRGGLRCRRGRHRGRVVAEVKEGVCGHHHDQHGEHGHRRVEDVDEPPRADTVLPRESLPRTLVGYTVAPLAPPAPFGAQLRGWLFGLYLLQQRGQYSSIGRTSQTLEPRPGEVPRTSLPSNRVSRGKKRGLEPSVSELVP